MIRPLLSVGLALIAVFVAASWESPALAAPTFEFPWPAGQYHRINSGYGYGLDDQGCGDHYGTNRYAIDFEFTGGDLVASAAPGTIIDAKTGYNGGQGNFIQIDHGGGYKSRYLHLTETFGPGIAEGVAVAQNQLLGYADNSGWSQGDHLHFDVKLNGAAYKPEPMSGQSGFGAYGQSMDPLGLGCGAWRASPSWSPHGWQPAFEWTDWGPIWGLPSVTENATASAHENPNYVSAHTALARINRYGEGAGYNFEWQQWNGSVWIGWTDINVWPSDPIFDGKIGISNHEGEIDVVGVSAGTLWHRKRTGSTWNAWTNLGYPAGHTIDGPVAVSNSSGRIGIVAIAQGTAYFKKYQGSWSGWTAFGGAGTLGGAVAISTRPNGIYSVAAFVPATSVVWTSCSANGTTWTNWGGIGGMLADSLAIDNSGTSNCTNWTSDPGVHVVAFANYHTMIRCWASYCIPGWWQDLGAMLGGPVAIANTNGQVSIVPRGGLDAYNRQRK